MGASDMREQVPGYRFAHPGYARPTNRGTLLQP
jgi:hypothetical protein